MKLVIDRRFWLRGEGFHKSFLRRSLDGKMCCLGFLAKACGATDAEITNKSGPSEVDGVEWPEGMMREATNGEVMYTLTAAELMRSNDYFRSEMGGESERESRIQAGFEDLGIEVEFIN